jgi:hypothetical protein
MNSVKKGLFLPSEKLLGHFFERSQSGQYINCEYFSFIFLTLINICYCGALCIQNNTQNILDFHKVRTLQQQQAIQKIDYEWHPTPPLIDYEWHLSVPLIDCGPYYILPLQIFLLLYHHPPKKSPGFSCPIL